MKFDLQLRDLRSGQRSLKAFESMEEAKTWLSKRPKYADVMGVAGPNLSHEENLELKAALRPLDADELALERALNQIASAEAMLRAEVRRQNDQADAERARAAAASADPNRQMEIEYRFTGEMAPTDANDQRPITPEARAAVLAFVEERNQWVKGRGQIVGQAKVVVWPNALPEGETERVVQGSFVPVSGEEPSKPN